MQKKKILIVEDETAIAKMIAMNLRVANYDTKIYEDGAEAAKGLEQDHAYDLALLDVMLPGMDGFSLLPIVNEYDIPVIFLTAKDDLASKIQGLKGGAEDYKRWICVWQPNVSGTGCEQLSDECISAYTAGKRNHGYAEERKAVPEAGSL